jgi:transposase-like protein
MSQPTVKKYPAEFKERAVKLAVESDQPIAQTAVTSGAMKTRYTPGSGNSIG